jgi:hypothetical protein
MWRTMCFRQELSSGSLERVLSSGGVAASFVMAATFQLWISIARNQNYRTKRFIETLFIAHK